MSSIVNSTAQWLATIGADEADDDELRLYKSLLVVASAMLGSFAVVWGFIYLALGQPLAASILLSYSVLCGVSIALFSRTRRYRLFKISQLAMMLALPLFLSLALGGLTASSGVVLWALLSPMGALVFSGSREARGWLVAFVVAVALSLLLTPLVDGNETLSDTSIRAFTAMNIVGTSLIAFVLLHSFVVQRQVAMETSEALLLNILPRRIAEVLKKDTQTIAEHYEGATVLFADVVDFTPMSQKMSPNDLGDLLNEVFTYFDDVVDELGIEKIKIIGDCYMAAAGVPEPRGDHAGVMVDMALQVRDHVESHDFRGQSLAFRIGINSGPLVAGVIGKRKFIYDLWGDVVNTASRMESHGQAGTVQITKATYDLVKDDFECEPKGTVHIKGKGEMEIWHVLGSKEFAA